MRVPSFIPKGITWVRLPAGCLRAGSFFSLHNCMSAPLSTCLWQSILNALSRAGEILLPVGYSPHSFLREALICYTLSLLLGWLSCSSWLSQPHTQSGMQRAADTNWIVVSMPSHAIRRGDKKASGVIDPARSFFTDLHETDGLTMDNGACGAGIDSAWEQKKLESRKTLFWHSPSPDCIAEMPTI